jgi:hypothetical protein
MAELTQDRIAQEWDATPRTWYGKAVHLDGNIRADLERFARRIYALDRDEAAIREAEQAAYRHGWNDCTEDRRLSHDRQSFRERGVNAIYPVHVPSSVTPPVVVRCDGSDQQGYITVITPELAAQIVALAATVGGGK